MSNPEKKFGHSIYYMNDQNIRDGLLAQKVKASHLIKILKDRNIIVSPLSSKEELINMLKFIRFDYYDYVHLSAILANQDKKESKSSIDIDKKVTSRQILSTFESIKGVLEARQITAEVSQQSSKKITINFEYVEFDHSKPPMRQKSLRKGVVECDITNTGAMLNYPENKVGAIIKDHLIEQLSKKLDTELKPIEFDFENSNVATRNNFFLSVINNVDKYEVYDVVTVAVKKIEEKKAKESSSSGDSNNDSDNDSVGEAFTGEVRNAILRGNQILTSKVYSGLNTGNYYIYKITWKIREIIPNVGADQSDCFTVEIEFSDKDKAKGLKYCVKTVQRFSTKNKLNVTTENPLKSEQEKLGKLIYKTALDVYSKI